MYKMKMAMEKGSVCGRRSRQKVT